MIEQITYLQFLRALDDMQALEENKAARLKQPPEHRIFPAGNDPLGRSYDDLRWSRFRNFASDEMYEVVDRHVFPFLRTLGGSETTYAHHMKDARFTIPTPQLLAKVVDLIADVPMEDRDTKGDLYEYMLGKIASAGQNGQFRTPRHIIELMVELTAPKPGDVICDPACGTAGFLVAAGFLDDPDVADPHGIDPKQPLEYVGRAHLVLLARFSFSKKRACWGLEIARGSWALGRQAVVSRPRLPPKRLIPPGEPWRNPFIESFNGRLRDEFLNLNVFWSLAHARVLITDWKHAYNHHRPHSSLGYVTPAEYAASCST